METTEAGTSSAQFYLGIDGGGSKTVAVIVDAEGNRHAQSQAGSANHHAVGLKTALANLHRAACSAADSAGCSLPLTASWIGIAGLDNAADHEILLPHLYSLATGIRLTNDAELVLSVLDHTVGVALIAGTGAIAVGRDGSGNYKRASGWGHILGDEGSGYDIGRQALQAAVRALDGRGEPTALAEAVMDYWKLRGPDDLLSLVYHRADKAEIARLSPLVFEIAQSKKDTIARRIIQRAARELALTALTVGNALDFAEGDMPLALGGSLLLFEADYRDQAVRSISRRRAVSTVALATDPALSAARAARYLADYPAVNR
ncbi:MAG: N-acetylglucosamine kinase [Ktedonobacterales bacterium]